MRKSISVLLVVFLCAAGPSWAIVGVEGLRCEYLKNPLGIDVCKPRLGWILRAEERGQRQTAYQVLVASTPGKLAADQADLWDSGKVASDQSIHVEYAGSVLVSRRRCHWKVRVWDKDGLVSVWSEPALWTMGLLDSRDWAARWIGAVVDRPERTADQRNGIGAADEKAPAYAAVLLRKETKLSKPVTRVTAHICGLGYYEIYVNGRKAGDRVLDPGFTDYTKRVLYATYDVTALCGTGPVTWGVMLGCGWYDSPAQDVWSFHTAPWIAPPTLLLNVDVEYADGTHESVVSDASWKVSTSSPIVFNSIRGGEIYDTRREKPGWDRPGYDDSQWSNARVMYAPQGRLTAQRHPPIRVVQSLRPIALAEPKPGVYVFDLGVNIAGWAQLKTHGSRGHVVTLDFNEKLNADGTLDTHHLAEYVDKGHGRFQTGQMILSGKGEDVFEPHFTYFGFRYVQVTGLSERPTLDSLTGRRVHTAPEPAGAFSCSNPLLNRLQDVFVRTQLNNLHGIPTDCPQREKNGWMHDGCVTVEEALFNFDMAGFYEKWFYDMLDAQDANGHTACISPSPGWGRSQPDGSPERHADLWWGGAIIRTPWQLYRYYGDLRILDEGYSAMAKYMDYVASYTKDDIPWGCEGDWFEEGAPTPFPKRTPKAVTSAAAYYHYARIMSQTAGLLGKSGEAKRYDELAVSVRDAFNRKLFDPTTGLYAKDSQTAQALPLYFDMVPSDKRALVLEQLLKNIQVERKNHISTGIVGTLYLFLELMEQGRDDVAYAMAVQEEYPGWGYMLHQGATALWESWSDNDHQSFNHPALASIGVWFYQALGGIRPDPDGPGFKRIIIKPAVVGDLTWVKARYASIHGTIVSDWSRDGNGFSLNVEIPVNTTARVYVPAVRVDDVMEGAQLAAHAPGVTFVKMDCGKAVFAVGSGNYRFTSHPVFPEMK